MIVEQLYTDNSLRNFNYLIACPDTKEAIAIDPLRVDLILDSANKNNYKITKIINTHEHADHTDGNKELVDATGAKVYCHHNAVDQIPCAEFGLKKNDIIELGKSIKLKVLDTPGHTMVHVCLLASDTNYGQNNMALFSGDTLFNAGAGNVYSGNVDDLYNTFVDILFKLPDTIKVYPGHDYLENNLEFTLDREPLNIKAKELLTKIKSQDPHNPYVTTLAIEKDINTFFRLTNQNIISNLACTNDDIYDGCSQKSVFIALRDLRNKW